MLKDINQINLKGSIFDIITTLDLFSSNEQSQRSEKKEQKEKIVKATLIYGRNGTGKSTIAKAFRQLSGETISIITDVYVCNKSDEQISLSEEDKAHIFVFDDVEPRFFLDLPHDRLFRRFALFNIATSLDVA